MQPLDEWEIDIRLACCEHVRQARRDRLTTRAIFLVPAMGSILAGAPVDLADAGACRAALLPFFGGALADLDADLPAAILWARGLLTDHKAA